MKRLFTLIACALFIFTAKAAQFELVTSVSDLATDDEIVFGFQNNEGTVTKVSSNFMSNKESLSAVNATLTNNVMVVTSTSAITLTKLANGNFTMAIGSKPIGHKSGTNKFDTNQKTSTEFAITIATNGVATVASQTGTYNFYYNTTSPRFGLYSPTAATNGPIKIYKLLEEPPIPVDAESVELSASSISVRMGETGSLTATVLPEDASDKSVTWGTLDATIATVSGGTITPVSVGTVDIYVETTVGAHRDTCTVTVLPMLDNTTATWNIVQFPDTLKTGTRVFFGTSNTSKDYVMGRYASGSNIKGAAATYDDDHRTVTAELQYAYIVERNADTLYFRDCDGRYLSAESTTSTSAVAQKSAKCKWILTIDSDEGISTLKNAYYSSSNCYLLFNYNASPVCFRVYGGTSTNIAALTIYSDNAPEWYERERHPEINVATASLDWGTTTPEYGEWGSTMYIDFTISDLEQAATVTLTDQTGTFYCYWEEIPATTTYTHIPVEWGITQADYPNGGEFNATITISYPGLDNIVIPLHAKAVKDDDPSVAPWITVSTERIYINLSYENTYYDIASFTFSAGNLAKTLYCKWENGDMPTWSGQSWEALAGSGESAVMLHYGSATQLGTDDMNDVEVVFDVYAFQLGTYNTAFHFYTYPAGSSSEYAAEATVNVIITVTEEPTPDPTALDESQISNRQSQIINILGQPVGKDYHGIVIQNGQKRLQ